MARTALLLSALLSGLQSPAARAQVITFNRTAGEVEVGTCEGLKKHAELGLDVSIVVTDNLRCTETITLAAGVDVSIGSAVDESWLVAISENFSVADPTSINLLVNPGGSYLSLDQLSFVNEAGTVGSPGEVRAVWNEGTLDITGCSFEGLNYASQQDGGAIYSTTEPGSEGGGLVSVSNSTFVGNVAENHGGAIYSEGGGAVELTNCSFVGNEAVGMGDYRRAGSGGAIYTSPGVFVTVFNSTFEGCLGRYGGGAIFSCGADITDTIFDSNEATGLFGAVVNGDLSEEDRANASLSLGGVAAGENYTCPPLFVSSSVFDSNVAVTGYGGAIASVDSSLSVFNSSFFSTLGGGIYFGTSSLDGRDELELELIQFQFNDGSDSSPYSFGAAFLLERTGAPASNTTGTYEQIEPPTSSSSSVAVQSVGGSSGAGVVGTATDIYCFQNNPYECEGYFGGTDGANGDIELQLSGVVRCSACRGESFTGIGSPAGAPTPAPVAYDDDDGLSKMGQERAQGGTPSPAAAGEGGGSGDSSSGELGLGSTEDGSEPELLGVTGGMRWVVVGLIVGLGSALLVCMCLVTVCRTRDKKRSSDGGRLELINGGTADGNNDYVLGAAVAAGPRATSGTAANTGDTRGPGNSKSNSSRGRGGGGSRNPFFASSPGTSVVADVNAEISGKHSRRASGAGGVGGGGGDLSRSNSSRPPSGADLSRSSSRRPSENAGSSRNSSRRPSGRVGGGGASDNRDPRRDTTDSAVAVVNDQTPYSSELKAREVARQRSIQAMATRDEEEWMSPPLVSAWGEDTAIGGSGHVALSARNTPTKQGFVALPDDPNPYDREEEPRGGRTSRGESRERRGGSRERRPPAADRAHHRDQSPPRDIKTSAEEAAEAAARVTMVPRGRREERGRRGGGGGGVSASRSAGRKQSPPLDPRSLSSARVEGRGGSSRSAERPRGQQPQQQQQQQHQYPSRSPPRHEQQQQSRRSPEGAPAVGGVRSAGGSRSSSSSRNPSRRDKPPANGNGGGGDYGSPPGDGRGPGRAVKTPAGGARLPITSASPTPSSASSPLGRRGSGSAGRSAAAAAAASGVGIGGRSDSVVISSEKNPVFAHARPAERAGGRSGAVSRSPGRRRASRSRSKSSRGPSRERGDGGAGNGGGGWASDLYRMSQGS